MPYRGHLELVMDTYTLVCPFLTDDPAFARGVEFGLLYARMQSGQEDEVQDYFQRENQEQILLLASRLRWQVVEMQPHCRCWFWCHLKRRDESCRRL
jgi:hypothetical protein